jgi:hypothetical protein
MNVTGFRHDSFCLGLSLVLACLGVAAVHAESRKPSAWKIEPGSAMPSYAAVEPTSTNLNIDMVVLACEPAQKGRVLQLQLYLLDEGPLRPVGVPPAYLRDDPRAKISIDAADFPVAILFGGDYVVLADGLDGRFPRLSDRLLDSMHKGQSMILHFDLVTKRPDEKRSSDSKAIVDLRADGGREAIAAMRLCAGPSSSTGPLEDHAGYWLDVIRGGRDGKLAPSDI